jgi:hypothetical protein
MLHVEFTRSQFHYLTRFYPKAKSDSGIAKELVSCESYGVILRLGHQVEWGRKTE